MADVTVEVEPLNSASLQDKLDVNHPIIYADQVMGIGFGPFVSRFTFGVENHGDQTRTPVATVVMPTNMLHQVMLALVKQLEAPEFKAHAAAQYDGYLNSAGFKK